MRANPESPWEIVYAPVPAKEVGETGADYVPCFELNHGNDEVADILLKAGGPTVTFFTGEPQFQIQLSELMALLHEVSREFEEIKRRMDSKGGDSVAR